MAVLLKPISDLDCETVIKCPVFDIDPILSKVFNEVSHTKLKILIEIFKILTRREPTEADEGRFELRRTYIDKEQVLFDGQFVGTLTTTITRRGMDCVFEPASDLK